MVLVIDTSSPYSALAVVGGSGEPLEDVCAGGREHDLPDRVRVLVDPRRLEAVAVSVGPGSFTGLRVGVSYGVGLALGLRIPVRGFGSLELQAARTALPATALVEAGRGRLYWLAPGGEPELGGPRDLPRDLPAVGWLRPPTAEAVMAAGVRLLSRAEVGSYAAAAGRLIEASAELSYDTVKLRYMQSLRTVRE